MSAIAPCDVGHIGKMALADDIDLLVSRRPGLTELALAKSLFGRMGYQQWVTVGTFSGKAALNGMGPAVPPITQVLGS
jgi:hypothetical protein